MDGMILCDRNWPAAPAEVMEKPDDLVKTSVPGDFDPTVELTPVSFRYCCARVEQDRAASSCPSRTAKREPRVEVFSTAQVPIAMFEALKRGHVAGDGCDIHVSYSRPRSESHSRGLIMPRSSRPST
jgi:hypothetical protein